MPSVIEVRCKCGRKLRAKSKLAGKLVRCPNCQTQLRIPDQTGGTAEDPESTNLKKNTNPKLDPDRAPSFEPETLEGPPVPGPESESDINTPRGQTLPPNGLDVATPSTETEIGFGMEDVELELTLQPLESAGSTQEPVRQKLTRAGSYRRVKLEYADDVLAQAWKIFSKNARPILTAAFLFWFIPVLVAQPLGSLIALTDHVSIGSLNFSYRRIVLSLAIPAVVSFLAQPVMIYIVAGAYVGSVPTLAQSWEFIKPRIPKLVGTIALVFAVMACWTALESCVLLVVGGKLGLYVLFIPHMFVTLSLVMVIPAVVCEGISGIPALKRSFTLMSAHWMMLWAIYILLGIVSIVIASFTAVMLPSLLAPIASVAIQAGMAAFITTVLVSLYFSSRATMEEFSVASMRQDLGL